MSDEVFMKSLIEIYYFITISIHLSFAKHANYINYIQPVITLEMCLFIM